MAGNDVLDLFQQFELLYYPHFCILEPVDSLSQLYQDSPLLFWTIVLVATRHHITLHVHLPALQQAHMTLHAKVLMDAIQSLHEIQAVLMICTWPGPVKQQPQDPSWQQLGLAINAARQMGLHKATDWFILGSKPFKTQLSKHLLSTRKMTWLKAFELDVQMSLWHGHTPTLSLPQHVQTIADFCTDLAIPRRYAACIEIYVQAARYLDAATDGMACDLSSTLVRQYDKALDAVKQRNADAWTVDAELMFLAAKLYLAGMRLSTFNRSAGDGNQEHPDVDVNDAFSFEALQAAYSIAVRMATLVTDLSNEVMQSDSSSKHLRKTHSMPGYPKNPVRFLFFAAIVLLKYIDSAGQEHTAETENARNAFSAIYQMFKQCERSVDHQRAARNLEIAGRAIGNGQTHIEYLITARMSGPPSLFQQKSRAGMKTNSHFRCVTHVQCHVDCSQSRQRGGPPIAYHGNRSFIWLGPPHTATSNVSGTNPSRESQDDFQSASGAGTAKPTTASVDHSNLRQYDTGHRLPVWRLGWVSLQQFGLQ